MMDWYPKVVLYMGVFDGGVIMLGGLVLAFAVMMGWKVDVLWDRAFPALGILIGSNIAAAIILGATRWLIR